MQQVNMQSSPRSEHFELFRTFDFPHFNMCANVDLTPFQPFIKQHDISFNLAIVYVLTRTANAIPQFRYRIRGEGVVEHEVVHPSTTIMGKGGVFSFCGLEYHERFPEFVAKAEEKIASVKERPRLAGEDDGRDDWLFMTAIPWVSFTSFMHPLKFPADSVPRFAWGKFFEDRDSLKMPLSVQGHHAVMDGLHVGRCYEEAQQNFLQPKILL